MVFSLIGKGMLKIAVHEYSGNVEYAGIFGGNGVSEFIINYSALFLISFVAIFSHHKLTTGSHSQTELEGMFFQSISIALLLIALEALILIGYAVITDA